MGECSENQFAATGFHLREAMLLSKLTNESWNATFTLN